MDKRHLDGDALCDYAEGLLPPEARREAEAHLEGCAECRRELEAVGGYFREMAALPTLKAPEKFLTRVHARIDQASPWKRMLALLSSPRLLPVPLAVLVVAGVGAYLAIVSRDLAGAPQAGSAPARQEESLATLPPPAADEARQAEPKPETLDPAPISTLGPERRAELDPLMERIYGKEKKKEKKAEAGYDMERLAKAPPAPKPAPAEPALIASVEEASEEAAPALESLNSAEQSLDALALSDRTRAAGTGSGERLAAENLDPSGPAPGSAGESGAFASSPVAPAKALRKGVPASTLRGKSARAEADAAASGEAMTAREAGGGGTWRVPGLHLEWNPKADPETFFDGIEDLGIRILRSDESRIHRYELLVPAGRLDSLEAYLRTQGKVTKVQKHLGAGRAGDPAVITLRIHGDFSGR